MNLFASILCLFCLFATGWSQDEDGPVVEISTGAVLGNYVSTHYGIDVTSFWGIPYGAPPVGPLRFEVSVAVNGHQLRKML